MGIFLSKKLLKLTDKYIGSRVRMRRLMLGMNLTELGDALGMTFQQIQKFEKGDNRISASRLLQLSKVLQVPPSFFVDGAPYISWQATAGKTNGPTLANVSDFLATSDGLKIANKFIQIKDVTLRRRIADLVEQIANR
jgi:transcriptional regulator with XRE-family HTH domain